MISPKEAAKILEKTDTIAIDVRTPKEFQSVNIEGSVNVPLDQIKKSDFINEQPKEQEVVLVCLSGQRSGMALKELKALGHSNIKVMEGGVTAWESQGLPLNKGKQTMSLERQVRIAAGALVFVGTLLGLFTLHDIFSGGDFGL